MPKISLVREIYPSMHGKNIFDELPCAFGLLAVSDFRYYESY